MRCEDITEELLAPDAERGYEIDRHLADCVRCAHVAGGLVRLDSVLGAALTIQPPLDLQRALAQLAVEFTNPETLPWWRRALRGELNFGEWLVLQPHVVAAQGLAAMMLALAAWQVFGFLNAVNPVLGDVGYAMQIVAASPAVVVLGGGLQIDLQSLGLWSVVGLCGWLLSENSALGRRLSALVTRYTTRRS